MSLVYRRKRKGSDEWTMVDPATLPKAAVPGARRSPATGKPISEMNNAELKAELKRRLPCCPEKNQTAA